VGEEYNIGWTNEQGGKGNRAKVGKEIEASKGLKYERNGVREEGMKEVCFPHHVMNSVLVYWCTDVQA
jgi:hypothetical protein